MKVAMKRDDEWKPVTIELTFETVEEARGFHDMIGCAANRYELTEERGRETAVPVARAIHVLLHEYNFPE